MRALVVLLFFVLNLFACDLGSLKYKPDSESESVAPSPTPDTSCLEKNYRHKSEAELAAMTPRQLIDELIKSNPASFDSYSAVADYESSINRLVRKAGVNALPVLTEYMNGHDPTSASKCEELRFAVASRTANDLDRFEFRLRAKREGQLAIDALAGC